MIFDEEVKLLGELLNDEVYIVGGCVRNRLSGLEVSDVDVASRTLPDAVVEKASPAFFGVLTNKRLGTVKLTAKESGNVYEHTTFRVDSYPKSGRHTPLEIRFTKSIEEDARRRDFSVNALYYCPKTETIVDPTGGIKDLEKKILRSADRPEKVFGEDGLRIMRLARFAAELGFFVEDETFEAARKNVGLLADVSRDRIFPELEKILTADQKYPSVSGNNAVKRGLDVLDKLGALEVLFPNFCKNEGYFSAVENMPKLPVETRLAALFLSQNDDEAKRFIGDMKCSNDKKELTLKLISLSKTAVKTNEDAAKIVLQSNDNRLHAALLKRFVTGDAQGAEKIERQFSYMIENNLPFDTKGLFVSGSDTINLKIPENKRAAALKHTLLRVATDKSLDTREKQLQLLLEEV